MPATHRSRGTLGRVVRQIRPTIAAAALEARCLLTVQEFNQLLGSDNPLDGQDIGYLAAPALGDLDGDGDLDMVSGQYGMGLIYFRNDGSPSVPSFTQVNGAGNPFDGLNAGNYTSPVLVNLDGDGDLDLVVGSDGSGLRYFLNDAGSFVEQFGADNPVDGVGAFTGSFTSASFGDLDGDGDLDLIAGEYNGILEEFTNQGTSNSPNFVREPYGSLANVDLGRFSRPTLGDLDADGDLDLIVGERNNSQLTVFENQATPLGTPLSPVPADFVELSSVDNPLSGFTTMRPDGYAAPALGDLDGDGDEDLIVGLGDGTFAVFGGGDTTSFLPQSLQVVNVTGSSSGFVVEFNQPIEPTVINLYDSGNVLGASDVVVLDGSNNPVEGSFVIAADGLSGSFLINDGVLANDTYSVTLRSANDGFRTPEGDLLDGNADGTGGDDATASFAVSISDPVVFLPDFVRGPRQDVVVPNTGTGLTISTTDGAGITDYDITITFDPSLLTISGAAAAADLPIGSSVTLNNLSAGVVQVIVASPTGLPDIPLALVDLTASVPNSAAYATSQVLDLEVSAQTSSVATAVVADDAIHTAAYFGDLNASGTITAADVTSLGRFVLGGGSGSGFLSFATVNPILLADFNQSRSVTAGDVTSLGRFVISGSAGNSLIPPIPPAGGSGGNGGDDDDDDKN